MKSTTYLILLSNVFKMGLISNIKYVFSCFFIRLVSIATSLEKNFYKIKSVVIQINNAGMFGRMKQLFDDSSLLSQFTRGLSQDDRNFHKNSKKFQQLIIN